jgi:hypothetical protein
MTINIASSQDLCIASYQSEIIVVNEVVEWDPDLVPPMWAETFNAWIADSLGARTVVLDITEEWNCEYDSTRVTRPLQCCNYSETGESGWFWKYDSTDGSHRYFDALMRVQALGDDLFPMLHTSGDTISHGVYKELTIKYRGILMGLLTPGTWTLRVGVPHGGGNLTYNYEMMEDYFEVSVVVDPYPPPPPPTEQATVSLVDSLDWYDWLPQASGNLNQAGNSVVLRFDVDSPDPEQGYFLRMRLQSSRYPGAWTNDYRVWNDADDRAPQLEASPPNASWYNALDSESADLKLNNTVINGDWNIEFIVENWIEPALSQTGYFSAYYDELVYDGDEVEIEVTAYDMGGRSAMMTDIAPRPPESPIPPNPHTMEFDHNVIYKRTRWPETMWYQLPIPRDEEAYFTVNPYKGALIPRLVFGDGMGDAWEEQFEGGSGGSTTPRSISDPDDKEIFGDIKWLRPERDDSYAYSSFFPVYADIDWPIYSSYSEYLAVKRIGDGIVNFEKYRGFHGITDESLTTLDHERFNANYRNMLIMPFDHESVDEHQLNVNGNIGYFGQLAGIHLLEPSVGFINSGYHYHSDYVYHLGEQISYLDSDTLDFERVSDLNGIIPYGAYQLNQIFKYPRFSDSNPIYSLYFINIYNFPWSFIERYSLGWPGNDDIYGSTGNLEDHYYIPYNKYFCYLDASEIQIDLHQTIMDTASIYYSFDDIQEIVQAQLLKTCSHELGHWIGMVENWCEINNTQGVNDVSIMIDDFIDLDKAYKFLPFDYRYIQVSNPAMYINERHQLWNLESNLPCLIEEE